MTEVERLHSAAIVRHGETHSGFQSHSRIRESLGDADPYAQKHRPDDTEGFVTNFGRFVDRQEAVQIGVASGQLHKSWLRGGRPLLSSDVW